MVDVSGSHAPHTAPSLYRKPFAWLVFAIALSYVPLLGFLLRGEPTWNEIHPAINAMLNATSTVFLIAGFIGVRRKNIEFHWRAMLAAFITSGVFLVSYLIRYYLSGTHRYPGDGWDKVLYLVILFSHMALAVVVLPFILRLLWLARRKRFADHQRLARKVWPIWLYVSATGVVVYFMLYQL